MTLRQKKTKEEQHDLETRIMNRKRNHVIIAVIFLVGIGVVLALGFFPARDPNPKPTVTPTVDRLMQTYAFAATLVDVANATNTYLGQNTLPPPTFFPSTLNATEKFEGTLQAITAPSETPTATLTPLPTHTLLPSGTPRPTNTRIPTQVSGNGARATGISEIQQTRIATAGRQAPPTMEGTSAVMTATAAEQATREELAARTPIWFYPRVTPSATLNP